MLRRIKVNVKIMSLQTTLKTVFDGSRTDTLSGLFRCVAANLYSHDACMVGYRQPVGISKTAIQRLRLSFGGDMINERTSRG